MASEGFTLSCKTLTGDEILVDATPATLVLDVKKVICEAKDCLPDNIKLLKGRTFLKDDSQSLANYGIAGDVKLKVIIRLNHVVPHKEPLKHEGEGNVFAVALSPDDQFCISGAQHGSLKLWRTTTGECLYHNASAFTAYVCCIQFSQSGNLVIASSNGGEVSIWKFNRNGKPQYFEPLHHLNTSVGLVGSVYGLDITREETLLLTGDAENVRTWSVADGSKVSTIAQDIGSVYFGRFSPQTHTYIVLGMQDGTIKVYKTDPDDDFHKSWHASPEVYAIDVSRDEEFVISCGSDAQVKQYEITTGNLINTWAFPANVPIIRFFKDDEFIAAFTNEEGYILNVAKGNKTKIATREGKGVCEALALSGFRNAFCLFPDGPQSTFHKFKEEEFFACL